MLTKWLMMKLEYMFALRTESADRLSRSEVMMRIATATVCLGMVAMIITLSIFNGFREQIHSAFRGFGSDLTLFDIAGLNEGESASRIEYSEELVEKIAQLSSVERVAPYLTLGLMAKSGEQLVGLQLKGIDPSYDTEFWTEKIVEGQMPDIEAESRSSEVLLSQRVANALKLSVGDKFEVMMLDMEGSPRRSPLKVAGIYHTGLEEMDRVFALGDIRDVRRLAAVGKEQISGYDVWIGESAEADHLAEQVEEILYESEREEWYNLVPATLQMRYMVAFDWLKAHTVIAQVVLLIMMVVLLFNMAAAMLIMVFDRIGMIGMLKALGMRNRAIGNIFLIRSMLLFFRGAAWGNLIALSLIGVQALWSPLGLDPEGYMLSTLPVSFGFGWWIALNVGAMAVSIVVMVLPSLMVAKIRPEESLKYKL